MSAEVFLGGFFYEKIQELFTGHLSGLDNRGDIDGRMLKS
jgi:hypothetical protein